jgi:hypothetical protein
MNIYRTLLTKAHQPYHFNTIIISCPSPFNHPLSIYLHELRINLQAWRFIISPVERDKELLRTVRNAAHLSAHLSAVRFLATNAVRFLASNAVKFLASNAVRFLTSGTQ